MRFRYYSLVVLFLAAASWAQNSPASAFLPQLTPQQRQEHLEARRQNFATGRQLLRDKGVPFDPDELLREDWDKNLRSTLDTMPEMRESRYEKAPLKGAYLADTLYLPENVQLTGHTVIIANYLVFEGKNPVIKGNFDLHFFPAKPVAVLGTSLASILQRKPGALNVKAMGRMRLPSFPLIKDLVEQGKHVITFDTSGLPPESERRPTKKPVTSQRSAVVAGAPAFNVAFQTTITCTTSCTNNGSQGSTGGEGISPLPSASGIPSFTTPAPDGSCGGVANISGSNGAFGGNGQPGVSAGTGGPGGRGVDAGNINGRVADGDPNVYTFSAAGGKGGKGGLGGQGGQGGDGGTGQGGGNGVVCGCSVGNGGSGGQGGTAGQGGKGGDGGKGGNGGNGGVITVSIPFDGAVPITAVAGGQPGDPGDPGPQGSPGNPGAGGLGGNPGVACGVSGNVGKFLGSGSSNTSLGPGGFGTFGDQPGTAGSAKITPRANPNPISGGGGDPCLGGGGTHFTGGGAGGGNAPDCSPIIIDTEGEGFHLTSAFSGVSFDISGSGQAIQIAWTDGHFQNAFLTLPGADGLVHSGKELFGNFTPQPSSASPNGFLALAEFDKPANGGNGDGIIDDQDEVFSRLRLWIDTNHDGVCQPEELHRLPEFGIYSLALDFTQSKRTDEFGNVFRYRARVNPGPRRDTRDQTPNGDPGRWAYDVFFVGK